MLRLYQKSAIQLGIGVEAATLIKSTEQQAACDHTEHIRNWNTVGTHLYLGLLGFFLQLHEYAKVGVKNFLVVMRLDYALF